MTRPPRQVNASDPSVMRGRTFFNANCATCHVPSMKLYSAQLFIEDPGIPTQEPSDCIAHPFQQSLTAPNDASRHPILLRLGNVLSTGYFQNSADFGGGPLTSAGRQDAFVLSLGP